MNEDLNKVLNKITEEENLAKEFCQLDDMDEMYKYCLELGEGYTEEEFDEGISELISALNFEGETTELSDGDLDRIAGGLNMKDIVSKTAAIVLSALTMGGVMSSSAKAVDVSQSTGTTQSFFTRARAKISDNFPKTKEAWADLWKNHKGKIIGAVTVAAAAIAGGVAIAKHRRTVAERQRQDAANIERAISESNYDEAIRRAKEETKLTADLKAAWEAAERQQLDDVIAESNRTAKAEEAARQEVADVIAESNRTAEAEEETRRAVQMSLERLFVPGDAVRVPGSDKETTSKDYRFVFPSMKSYAEGLENVRGMVPSDKTVKMYIQGPGGELQEIRRFNGTGAPTEAVLGRRQEAASGSRTSLVVAPGDSARMPGSVEATVSKDYRVVFPSMKSYAEGLENVRRMVPSDKTVKMYIQGPGGELQEIRRIDGTGAPTEAARLRQQQEAEAQRQRAEALRIQQEEAAEREAAEARKKALRDVREQLPAMNKAFEKHDQRLADIQAQEKEAQEKERLEKEAETKARAKEARTKVLAEAAQRRKEAEEREKQEAAEARKREEERKRDEVIRQREKFQREKFERSKTGAIERSEERQRLEAQKILEEEKARERADEVQHLREATRESQEAEQRLIEATRKSLDEEEAARLVREEQQKQALAVGPYLGGFSEEMAQKAARERQEEEYRREQELLAEETEELFDAPESPSSDDEYEDAEDNSELFQILEARLREEREVEKRAQEEEQFKAKERVRKEEQFRKDKEEREKAEALEKVEAARREENLRKEKEARERAYSLEKAQRAEREERQRLEDERIRKLSEAKEAAERVRKEEQLRKEKEESEKAAEREKEEVRQRRARLEEERRKDFAAAVAAAAQKTLPEREKIAAEKEEEARRLIEEAATAARQKAERQRVEAERQRVEAERREAEKAERQRAEAERRRAEEERQRPQRIREEIQRLTNKVSSLKAESEGLQATIKVQEGVKARNVGGSGQEKQKALTGLRRQKSAKEEEARQLAGKIAGLKSELAALSK